MHQIQFIHQATLFEQLQRPVYRDAIQLRVFLPRQLIQALRIEVPAGFVDQIEQDLPLTSEAHPCCAGCFRYGGGFQGFRHCD